MEIDHNEVFPNSILSEVVFEARFTTQLGMEEKLPKLQDSIIEKFPQVTENYRPKIIVLSNNKPQTLETEKMWEFSNEEGTILSLTKQNFAITSKNYSSWNNHGDKQGFKNLLFIILKKFNSIFKFPEYNRIGLRYINKKEIDEYNSTWFSNYFLPIFKIDMYPIENLTENVIRIRKKIENYRQITVQLLIQNENEKQFYIMDFDAFNQKIKRGEVFTELENLHDVIIKEFHMLIKPKLRDYMRRNLD